MPFNLSGGEMEAAEGRGQPTDGVRGLRGSVWALFEL